MWPTSKGKNFYVCFLEWGYWMAANRLKLNTDKTELLWAGSKSGSAPLGRKEPPLRLGSEVIATSDHVRLLGVRVSSDLSLQKKHACSVCSSCFYWLRQILKIRRSLDTESAKTLVHAFVTFRVDYCNTVLADSPKIVMDRLQCVLNAAVRVVSQTRKFDRGLTRLLHTELHWLQDVPGRVQYKLGVTFHRCMQHKTTQYLVDCCTPSSDIASRQRLRTASRR